MATLFRAPLLSLRGSRSMSRVPHASQTDVWANRLSTLFVTATSAPVTPVDWPNPLRSDTRFALENRTQSDPSEFWLLKDKFFGGAGQPPSPCAQPNPAGSVYPQTLLGFVQSSNLFSGTASPFSSVDWPNPASTRFPTESRTQADATEFWLLAAVNPSSQTDWPTPRGATGCLDLRTIAASSAFGLLKDQFFGAAGQPPSPPAAVNPRGYPTPLDARTWTQSHLLDTLAPVTVSPFTVSDWPNPIGPRSTIDQRTQADGTELWLLAPVATAAPFTSIDWPNATLKPFPIEDRTQADPSEIWLLKDTFFGGAGQPPTYLAHPNPRMATVPTDARTWVQSLLQSTLLPLTPAVQLDWPAPAGYRYPLSLRTLAEFTRLPGKDKMFGGPGQPITVWPQPNPLGYRYPTDLRTILMSLAAFTPSGVPATADYLVLIPRGDYVIHMPVDDTRVLLPRDGEVEL